MNAPSSRIAIVDGHPLFVEGLTQKIVATGEMEVVFTAADSDRGLRLALEHQPEIVLINMEISGRGAFTLADELARRLPIARIVFLSDDPTDVFLDEALRLNAAGVLLTNDPTDRLMACLRTICHGGVAFSADVMERLEYQPDTKKYVVKVADYLASLTGRQTTVLRHLVRGDSVKEVSKTMSLSERAIESHKYRIMRRLGIHDRVELARYAIREGLALP
ncbi:MAG: response regulator transcription factor [Planctomycetaceae bacterium]|nr:response regulator transcription factor [Planctomycetaceae bacterium]